MTGKLHGSDRHAAPGNSDTAGKKNKIMKKVKQSNHDEYILPPCMVRWADEPLYLIISRWGMKQKRWIDRNDIVATFHIPDRRASFQISYISRKKERVACRSRYVPVEGGGRQRVEIFIDRIIPARDENPPPDLPRRRNVPAKQAGPTSRGVGNGMTENIGLWEQLLKGCRKERDDE